MTSIMFVLEEVGDDDDEATTNGPVATREDRGVEEIFVASKGREGLTEEEEEEEGAE